MKAISVEGYDRPDSVSAGQPPVLQWLAISDLVMDPSSRNPMRGKARRDVREIARNFSWAFFATVVVTPLQGGKFAIIDGRRRTTAAAVIGLDKVPCQIVNATPEEQLVAFRAINGSGATVSRMALHAAGVVASDPWSVQVAEACARAEVELLRYPVPVERQTGGQTMAVGAIARCLKRHGEETLITALQCVTQTTNNKPGALSARMIKALCEVLGSDHALRDSGLQLLETFDEIDLLGLAEATAVELGQIKGNAAQALANRIRAEVARCRRAARIPSPQRKLLPARPTPVTLPIRNAVSGNAGPQPRSQKS